LRFQFYVYTIFRIVAIASGKIKCKLLLYEGAVSNDLKQSRMRQPRIFVAIHTLPVPSH